MLDEDLPNGTVTLLFTDVEGSTRLLRRLGDHYATALEDQRRILREAVDAHGGREIDCRGDEFFAAFPRARSAVAAAVAAQRALAVHSWPAGDELRVRMGLHTGEPALRDDGYLGLDVHRAARIAAAAHGGQVVISQVTREIVEDDIRIRDLGEHQLKDLPRPERLFQVVIDGLVSEFPPPKTATVPPAVGRERELAAVVFASPRRLAERIRPRPRGLADLGWDVRASLASAAGQEHESLSRLARQLFDASSVAAEADHSLATLDRKALAHHLSDSRSAAVLSKVAAREAESTQQRLDALDELAACRRDLEAVAGDIRTQIRAGISPEQAETFCTGLRVATDALNVALETARGRLDVVSGKLRRTRHPGVFRIGEQFVVPYYDEVGVERREVFESSDDAAAFRRAMKIAARDGPGDPETARMRREYLGGSFVRNAGQRMGILPPRTERRDRG